MSLEEFGQLTPKQFQAFSKYKEQVNEAENYKHASLLATILNSRMGVKKENWVTPEQLIGKPKTVQIKTVEEMKLAAQKFISQLTG